MSEAVVDTFDVASLDAFISDLVGVGFEPVAGTDRRVWRSNIHPAFAPLTDATKMDLVLVNGWPYQPPALLVQGLNTNHSTLGGLVCMWREDDASLRWTTLSGLYERISEWCSDAQHGWAHDDLGRDARLNFVRKAGILATFDVSAFHMSRGGWGDFHGVVVVDPFRVDLAPGSVSASAHLRGLWFEVGEVAVPPRRLSELQRCLSRPQWRGLQRELDRRRDAKALVSSNGVDLILFCWERAGRLDLLVMACESDGEAVEAIALRPGSNDETSLILRAGPDASTLRQRTVVVFGAGALGGHLAVTLAESGLGHLHLVDSDVLSPGNVVRHVAGHDRVGDDKTHAVEAVVQNHAPWTEVSSHTEAPSTPTEIATLIESVDLVIDATGSAPVTYALAAAARLAGKPLVSGALYRGGFIGRVRRQARSDDVALDQRGESDRYPVIPPDDNAEDLATPELGCSAPVNNAPPHSVLACASLVAQAAIDILTARFELEDELIDVYRALVGSPPFDRVGRFARS